MATLFVSATDDFSADLLSDIERIEFTNLAIAATATFAAAQFDGVAIRDTVTLVGSVERNRITVNGAALDASAWQFATWDETDVVRLNGLASDDIITGSAVADVIKGQDGDDTLAGGGGTDIIKGGTGRDAIIGGASADDLQGGDGNDRFVYSDAADDGDFFEAIDGGSGNADRIILEGSFDGLTLLFAEIADVEEIVFKTAGLAHFSGSHIRLGSIATITGSSGSDQLRVSGSDIDLSGVVFDNWTEASDSEPLDVIFAYGIGATDDTITGSSLGDLIHGFDGDDTLSGGEGNDTLSGDEGRDEIDGGAGDDIIELDQPQKLEDGETIGGGIGSDTLHLHAGVADTSYDFTGCVISGVETLSITGPLSTTGTLTVTFAEGQFGFGGIAAAEISAPTLITITAFVVDLSQVTFSGTLSAASTLLTGNSGADVLVGGGLTDIFVGGSEVDVMQGKSKADTFRYNAATEIASGEVVDGGGGDDTLELAQAFTGTADIGLIVVSSVEQLAMLGSGQTAQFTTTFLGQLEEVTGADGVQTIDVSGADIDASLLSFSEWSEQDRALLTGTANADSMIGSSQNDTLTGAAGGDELTGGLGADIFVYADPADSSDDDDRDLILDFTQSEDRIGLDALATSIVFVGEEQFGGTGASEVRYKFVNGSTQLLVDTDGDGAADCRILLSGEIALTEDDLIL